MKKVIPLFLVGFLLTSLYCGCAKGKTLTDISAGVHIFVAPNGSDMNDGSLEHPFQTFQRAQLEVRAIKARTHAPITVNIRGGEYFFANSLRFSDADSGTETAPVTWQAYDGERVLLSGGIKLSAAQFSPVTDEAIRARVLDETAREQLMCIDLSGYLEEIPGPIDPDTDCNFASGGPEIYVDGQPLTRSRFPNQVQNQAFLFADSTEALPDAQGTSVRLTSQALAERTATWSPDAWENLYAVIFMNWDWANGVFAMRSFDAATGAFVTGGFWDAAPQENPRFYVFNLLEEIDVPGESYMDYEHKTVYFYPPEGFAQTDIYLSLLKDDLIRLDGGEHLTFRGLTLGYTRGDGIGAFHVRNIHIEGCTIAHASRRAITLNDATNCTVKNCHLYDTVDGSLYLWDGGLRKTLTPSGNRIENNHIHDNNRLRKWTTGSMWCESMGLIVRNNEIHDEPVVALFLNGSNDALVEFNEFYRTGLDVSDTGAIYYGRDPSVLGVTIRYNYFHDIGNDYGGIGQQAIFCDDGAMMPYIYGNLFVNASDKNPEIGAAIKANGSQFGVVENNIFVDSPHAAFFQPWSDWEREPMRQNVWLQTVYDLTDGDESDKLWPRITESVDAFSTGWRDHYQGTQWDSLWRYVSPEGYAEATALAASGDSGAVSDYLYEHAPLQTNLFDGNVCVKTSEMFLENGRGGTNYEAAAYIFKDYVGGDFSLTPEGLAEIREAIPGFEEIPLEEIGLKLEQR